MTLAPEAEAVLRRLGELGRGPSTIAQMRAAHDRLALTMHGRGPVETRVTAATAPLSDGVTVPLRIYEPPAAPSRLPALLWIHGGGYVMGSLDSADALCRRLALDVHCRVVSVGYRLGPENTIADTIADVDAAWAHLQRVAGGTTAMAVGGDSAGGGIAAVLARRLRDGGAAMPCLQLLLYPVTALDVALAAANAAGGPEMPFGFPWGVSEWLGGRDASHPDASPARAPVAGGGPVHVVVGTEDFLYAENLAYARALVEGGVDVTTDVVDGMPHGFVPWQCGVDAATACYERVVRRLRSAVG